MATVQKLLDSPVLKYREVHQVRWLSFYQALETVYQTLDSLISFFTTQTDPKAIGIRKKIGQDFFILTTYAMMDILQPIMKLNLFFQKKDVNIGLVQTSVDACLVDLISLRDGTVNKEKPTFTKQADIDLVDGVFKGHHITHSKYSYLATRQQFIQALVDNITRRFPDKQIMTSFCVLGLRPVTLLSDEDLTSWGNESLEILLDHFGKEKQHSYKVDHADQSTTSPAIIDAEKAQDEWIKAEVVPPETTAEAQNLYVEQRKEASESISKSVTTNIDKAHEKQRKNFAQRQRKGRKHEDITVGKKVLMRNARKASTKKKGNLEPNYHGPYKVVNIDGKSATLQNDSGHILKKKSSVDHLKVFLDQTNNESPVPCMQNGAEQYVQNVSADGSLSELIRFISELNLSKISLHTIRYQYNHCPQQSFLKDVGSEVELECFGTLLLPHLRHLDMDLSAKTSVAMLASAVCVKARQLFQPLMAIAQTLKEVPSQLDEVDMELPPLSPTQRLTVGGKTLEAMDITTLDEGKWINDKVINAFLALKKIQQNTTESGNHIFVLPSYTAVQWDQGQLDHWMFKKVEFSKYANVLMPVCINGNHWVLLVADIKQRTVYILDSMNSSVGHRWTKLWTQFMAIQDSLPDSTEKLCLWNCTTVHCNKQTDGSSCGVFTMMNAECIAKGVPVQVMRKVHCKRYRTYVKASIFKTATVKSDSKCDMPECKAERGVKRWVQCCVCGRWFHTKCCNIPTKAAIEEDFECCKAMYR